ncbi:hypothetical protein HDV00_004182 [Rhizophlyctis rosea]|nr:hypothetical protein HDV00_004182 [Rhizophlyctis rosea]
MLADPGSPSYSDGALEDDQLTQLLAFVEAEPIASSGADAQTAQPVKPSQESPAEIGENTDLIDSIQALEEKLRELKRKKESLALDVKSARAATEATTTLKRKSPESRPTKDEVKSNKSRKLDVAETNIATKPSTSTAANANVKSFMNRLQDGSREYKKMQMMQNMPKAKGFEKLDRPEPIAPVSPGSAMMIDRHSGLRLK